MTDPLQNISILCCYSVNPREVIEVPFVFPCGIQRHEAVIYIQQKLDLSDADVRHCGVWGRTVEPHEELRSGDRLEFYRPLTVDPKVARRQRFKKQGAKRSGLFSKRRPGSAAGY